MQPTPGDAGHGTDSLRPELAGASRCWRGEMLVVIALEVVVRDRRDDPRSAQPLIGKSGSISVLISRIGQVGFAAGENRKLTGVELRPDGLIRLERDRMDRPRSVSGRRCGLARGYGEPARASSSDSPAPGKDPGLSYRRGSIAPYRRIFAPSISCELRRHRAHIAQF
jgi:hypothetical protein